MERSVGARKLLIDFTAKQRRGAGMDDDTAHLIAQLCTRIGMIMEDASPIAIGICGMNAADRRAAIAEIAAAAEQISVLSHAVNVLIP